jgi:hypothetical protein
MDTSLEPYWIPVYPPGQYAGTDPTRKSRKRKNPIGFAPPKKANANPGKKDSA